jgi:hypothetical protein
MSPYEEKEWIFATKSTISRNRRWMLHHNSFCGRLHSHRTFRPRRQFTVSPEYRRPNGDTGTGAKYHYSQWGDTSTGAKYHNPNRPSLDQQCKRGWVGVGKLHHNPNRPSLDQRYKRGWVDAGSLHHDPKRPPLDQQERGKRRVRHRL